MKNIFLAGTLAIIGGFIFCSTTYGVVIAGGTGTGNTNDIGTLVGWHYVGRIQAPNNAPSSITYAGHDWFITAHHVIANDNPTGVLFNGSSYEIDKSVQLTDSTGTGADISLVKVKGNVTGVLNPIIASSTPTNGSSLTMIGNGVNRYPELQTWWFSPTIMEQGYYLRPRTKNTVKRWGVNTVEGSSYASINAPTNTDYFYTKFDPLTNEGQGYTYDSGGGAFTGTTSSWELAGIMFAVDNLYTVNNTNAVFLTGNSSTYDGSVTYIADLSEYRDQIVDTIPEPLSAGMVLSMTAFALILKRIRLWFA